MGGDIVPAFVRRAAGRRLRLQGQRRARARPTATAATGATSGRCGSYYAAHMDVVSPLPVFNLYNFDWPIYTSYGPQPPAKLVQGADGRAGPVDEAVLSPGVVVSGGTVLRVGALAGGAGRRRRRGRGLGADERRPRSARARWCATRSSTRTSSSRPARRSASTPWPTEQRGFLVEDGLTVLGKDQQFPG